MTFTAEELETCLMVLQEVARTPSIMDGHERFKALVAKIHRRAKKGKRAAVRHQQTETDRGLAQRTAVVQQQTGVPLLLAAAPASQEAYQRPQHCYVCKQPFVLVHFFYHLLCPRCGALNWTKRHQRADLSGRIALVTGGRIKIGYQTTLKLLRDGGRVLVTTRFPQDAARRYQAEADSMDWWGRLEIHGLDLRDLPAVETFGQHVLQRESHLDILIHNAAQTVKRPLSYYQHLLQTDAMASGTNALTSVSAAEVLLEARPGYKGHLPGTDHYFPVGSFDLNGQQVDQRPSNSWRQRLGEVNTVELLEVFLVSTVSPFLLSNQLLPALKRSPAQRRFIVNVSAMEGQFARPTKNAFHPHTNMAKAALNMLTRTAAADLAQQSIYLNSVDTGWITDEKPLPQSERVREEQGFHLPLDAIDGASRIYDPIARGLNEPAEPLSGHFLKDYAPYPW